MLEAVRQHWNIENSLHWTLDVTFRQDQYQVRKDHDPQNLTTMPQVSHHLLKKETSFKTGIQGKHLNADWRGEKRHGDIGELPASGLGPTTLI